MIDFSAISFYFQILCCGYGPNLDLSLIDWGEECSRGWMLQEREQYRGGRGLHRNSDKSTHNFQGRLDCPSAVCLTYEDSRNNASNSSYVPAQLEPQEDRQCRRYLELHTRILILSNGVIVVGRFHKTRYNVSRFILCSTMASSSVSSEDAYRAGANAEFIFVVQPFPHEI